MFITEAINKLTGIRGKVASNDAGQATRDEVIWAWEQWQAAIRYFENVSDPELVDYAIYDIEATRRRYVYMLRRAQDMGIKMDISGMSGA